jgi:hypothetical protein
MPQNARSTTTRKEPRATALQRTTVQTVRRDRASNDKSKLSALSQQTKPAKSRKEARALGRKTYHGEPCDACGGTKRRVAKNQCVECRNAERRTPEAREKRQEYLTSPEQRRKRREYMRNTRDRLHGNPTSKLAHYTRKRIRIALKAAVAASRDEARSSGAKTFIGKPCEDCGGRERRVVNNQCCECMRERARENQRTDEAIKRRLTPEYRSKQNERQRKPEFRAKKRERIATDPAFRLAHNTRHRINMALKKAAVAAEAKVTRYASHCRKHGDVERLVCNDQCVECRRDRKNRAHVMERQRERQRSPKFRGKWRAKRTEYMRTYTPERRATDPAFRLTGNTRSRVVKALKSALTGAKKSARTIELLGCSIEFFMAHIEAQFEPGWTWSDWGTLFHIDHKRPLASFDLRKASEQRKAFSYRNTRPMLGAENISKGSLYRGKRWRHSDHAQEALT